MYLFAPRYSAKQLAYQLRPMSGLFLYDVCVSIAPLLLKTFVKWFNGLSYLYDLQSLTDRILLIMIFLII